jgi:putative DNA methylase
MGASAYADAVVTYLSLALDKAANLWSSIVSWMNDRGAFREVFARQAIPMTWDFAEANPFSGRGGDWSLFVDKIKMAIEASPVVGFAEVAQRDARARIVEVGKCVMSTDPPYYDNICYADLSDFFYVWLRRNLADIWPDEMATLLTPKTEELIANQYRAGSKDAARDHFESGMLEVFTAAAKNADERIPATIFYAFKAVESSSEGIVSTGWETFLAGLLQAGYTITATWPMRTESPGRILARDANALASSIVLACRPRQLAAPMATRGEFIAALRSEMNPAVRLLQVENIAPVDLAQSAMGPGIAIFSRYAKVVEADGKPMTVRAALGLINDVLAEVLSGEESEFDADTRFALTWFEQFGHNPGPFGDADLLARAKDTTVSGVAQAGLVVSRDGRVRLVERSELPTGWDPAVDPRLTVWETTQYLIRAVESSETEAAVLLARMGLGLGERARQLAYLLYGICDRRRWSDDGAAYNMLVTAWPEISRLASAGLKRDEPEGLF